MSVKKNEAAAAGTATTSKPTSTNKKGFDMNDHTTESDRTDAKFERVWVECGCGREWAERYGRR